MEINQMAKPPRSADAADCFSLLFFFCFTLVSMHHARIAMVVHCNASCENCHCWLAGWLFDPISGWFSLHSIEIGDVVHAGCPKVFASTTKAILVAYSTLEKWNIRFSPWAAANARQTKTASVIWIFLHLMRFLLALQLRRTKYKIFV